MNKNNFWLALWWWAARGFAHIWVFKFLEENSMLPSEIAWTSMWAIIASCIACWMSSQEIIKIVEDINFFKIIDFDFKTWLIKWEKIIEKFKEIFWKKKIEETKIPLKIIATNIDIWGKFIFDSWYIYDALRASVSIPWVIAMYNLNWNNFIDWWVINNLPIEVLKVKDVIAVSVLRDIARKIDFKTSFFNFWINKSMFWIWYQILQKTIDIMMSQNEQRSLKTEWKNITYIHPKFPKIDYHEFHRFKEIIEIGYKTAKEIII